MGSHVGKVGSKIVVNIEDKLTSIWKATWSRLGADVEPTWAPKAGPGEAFRIVKTIGF